MLALSDLAARNVDTSLTTCHTEDWGPAFSPGGPFVFLAGRAVFQFP
jgi:hypothetical protein